MKNKALISKIQNYATKDGPGLRTTVFFMGCNLKCLWCANPENMQNRQRIFYFKERCQHCGLCVQHATHHSIQFQEVGCLINRHECLNLAEMVELCPYDAYENVGSYINKDELVEKLLRDQAFYEVGKGGVTFSGGEAALQADYVKEVADELRKHNIHTCLDTAGHIETETLIGLVKHVDMVLYDIKAMDEQLHIKCTGVSNQLILKNAQAIARHNIPMIIRLVIVPEYNDDLDDMIQRVDFITTLGQAVQQIDILKYHNYGVGKYDKLGEDYPISKQLIIDEDKIKKLYNYIQSKNIKVTIGG